MKKIYLIGLLVFLTVGFVGGCTSKNLQKNSERLKIFSANNKHSEAVTVPEARGIWLSEDYGWLLQIDDKGIKRWQYSESYCYPTPQNANTFMGSIEYRYITILAENRAKFEYLKSDGNTIYLRLAKMPLICNSANDYTPTELLNTFLSILKKHYAFFKQRGVNFNELSKAAKLMIVDSSSEEDLYQAMSSVISPLKDSHTKLFAHIDGEKRRYQSGLGRTLSMVKDTIGETPWLIALIDQTMDALDEGAVHTANDRILWGTLNQGTVGYIQVFTMGGFTTEHQPGSQEWADAELQYMDGLFEDIMKRFQTVEHVIIDLSNNRGGYDAIARKIASYFSDKAFTAYSVSTEWGDESPYLYTVVPHNGTRYSGPVSVLTSDITVSGGEIATLTLKQLPNVTHYGKTTRGAFSTPLAKPLPNGWYLELSNEIFAAPDGSVHEGVGIQPDIELDVFTPEEPVKTHLEALRKLIRHSL